MAAHLAAMTAPMLKAAHLAPKTAPVLKVAHLAAVTAPMLQQCGAKEELQTPDTKHLPALHPALTRINTIATAAASSALAAWKVMETRQTGNSHRSQQRTHTHTHTHTHTQPLLSQLGLAVASSPAHAFGRAFNPRHLPQLGSMLGALGRIQSENRVYARR